jgi:hypothetical protein
VFPDSQSVQQFDSDLLCSLTRSTFYDVGVRHFQNKEMGSVPLACGQGRGQISRQVNRLLTKGGKEITAC